MKVVCFKTFGMRYFSGSFIYRYGATYGTGGPIILDELACNGNETILLYCDHSPVGINDCGRAEQLGFVCK